MNTVEVLDKITVLDDFDDVLQFADLKKILKIGRNKTYELLKTNAISSFKIGRNYRIPKSEVVKYILQMIKN